MPVMKTLAKAPEYVVLVPTPTLHPICHQATPDDDTQRLESMGDKGYLEWIPSEPLTVQSSGPSLQPYLFLVGVRSAGLFSVSTTEFPLGAVVLLPMRGTISLEWAFITGAQDIC